MFSNDSKNNLQCVKASAWNDEADDVEMMVEWHCISFNILIDQLWKLWGSGGFAIVELFSVFPLLKRVEGILHKNMTESEFPRQQCPL